MNMLISLATEVENVPEDTYLLGWHHLPRDSHWRNYYVTSKKKSQWLEIPAEDEDLL